MFENTITWGDLFTVILFILATGVLFYLLLAIANLVGILKNVNKMIDKNRTNINSTMEKLPEITDNVAKVSDILKDEMESIQKVIGNVGKISDSARDAVEMIKKDVLVKAKNILDIIDWIKKLFQDKEGKKKDIVYKYKYKPKEETVEEEVYREETKENNQNHDEKQENSNNIKCKEKTEDTKNEKKDQEKTREGDNEQGAGI